MKNVDIHPDAIARVKDFKIEDVNLGFGKYVAPIMIQAYFRKGEWQKLELIPYGPLMLDPCAKVLHYGQEIFEGMKVFLQPNGEIHILDSAFYNDDQITQAIRRSEEYYSSLGFPEMSQYYFHHQVSELQKISPKWLYCPNPFALRIKRMFRKVDSPFPWVMIKSQ